MARVRAAARASCRTLEEGSGDEGGDDKGGDGGDGDGDGNGRVFPEHRSPILHSARDIISRKGKSLTPIYI